MGKISKLKIKERSNVKRLKFRNSFVHKMKIEQRKSRNSFVSKDKYENQRNCE